MNDKHVKRFIRTAIRSDNTPDEHQLRALLADIKTPDLQMFCFRFAGDRAASAIATVPDWKTREPPRSRTARLYRAFPSSPDPRIRTRQAILRDLQRPPANARFPNCHLQSAAQLCQNARLAL